jgi:hypothetical protein
MFVIVSLATAALLPARDAQAQAQIAYQPPVNHGDADPTAPRLDSNAFFAAMRDADVAHDMIVKRPGADPTATIQAELATLADWFDKQLRLD